MKHDREQKRAILGRHLPGFPGYRSTNQGETDLQLRRYLVAQMEVVRDRLAGFIAGRNLGDLQRPFGNLLREIAALKESFLALPQTPALMRDLAAEEEENLLDLDIALLDKVAALHTPIDRMEAAAAAAELQSALEQFGEGLAEAKHLFSRRAEILAGKGGRG